ncbi:cytochrome P450 [Novosphingobium sp. KCTC 2891]|uniref:cytochrome P450 n=1 Tax=Novosphingobium sp. KCTC 2891 TaxID=2989730 RepID=UPI0022213447|nr:cytochrome P450 [Novosphingobium sp. KCTC 2891]MCW1383423.1 cytochrome P450 [Novosphingobium sp. KCTC 2891]
MSISKEIANTIVDPRAYANLARIDAAFTTLRKDAPFEVAEADGFDPFWVATRHADVLEIEKRADVFLNGAGSATLADKAANAFVHAVTGEPNLVRSLVQIDGKEHKDLRAITFPAFTPKALKALEEQIRGIAREFVDAMIAKAPECDFARDVAFLYPLRVVMKVLGVPEEHEPFMLKLTQELFGPNDPDMNRTGKEVTGEEAMNLLQQTMLDLEAYFGEVTKTFRTKPESCINSLIANAKIDGEYLTHRQMMGYYIIAATAGHDTTANTTGAAMWALAQNPEVLRQLKEDPSAMTGFVEETIRWASPVKHFMRTAIADAEVAGQQVKKGDWVMLSYHSANRDEDVFDDPFAFKIDRPIHKHVAFGSGPHVCLGQHLARMEMRILWEELLPRLSEVSLAGEPKLTQSTFVCGPKTVPIRFTVA